MNRAEDRIVGLIDRSRRTADRTNLLSEAQDTVSSFMRRFVCPDERAHAAIALATALTPVMQEACGATQASTRLSALAGRVERAPAPRYEGGRR